MINLDVIQKQAAIWEEKNFGKLPPDQFLLGLMEELGELCHAHAKEVQKTRTNEDHIAQGKDAVGDIVIFLLAYCTSKGWDLESIIQDTWELVSQRDWKKYPATGRPDEFNRDSS